MYIIYEYTFSRDQVAGRQGFYLGVNGGITHSQRYPILTVNMLAYMATGTWQSDSLEDSKTGKLSWFIQCNHVVLI